MDAAISNVVNAAFTAIVAPAAFVLGLVYTTMPGSPAEGDAIQDPK
jgi:hypothetical protein